MSEGRQWLDDRWRVKLYNVQEASYEAIDLRDMTYPYWVMSFIVDGDVDVIDGTKAQHASSGQVMLHAPGIPFCERATRQGTHQWMLIEVTNSHQLDLFRLYPLGEVISISEPQTYSDIFLKLLDAWTRWQSPFREIELSGLGFQLVHLLLDSWDKSGRQRRTAMSSRSDERLNTVVFHLQQNFAEKITRETLAGLVHLNPNYLDKIFADRFGMRPMEMLRELRLKMAKRMLENTNESLAAIAAACSLGDAPYLTHQFHKRYGINPGQYRERVRRTNQDYYMREQ